MGKTLLITCASVGIGAAAAQAVARKDYQRVLLNYCQDDASAHAVTKHI
tara:strand:- start:366 stop:512 length:147 start_codon:yes stop_codon:yes gene_type:complete